MPVEHVDHIRKDDDRLAKARAIANHLQREIQAFLQAGGIDQAQHLLDVGIFQCALKLGDRYFLFRRDRLQRVGTGKIHQLRVWQAAQTAHAHIDRDPGKVRNFMRHAGEAIEQQALAGVWAADE